MEMDTTRVARRSLLSACLFLVHLGLASTLDLRIATAQTVVCRHKSKECRLVSRWYAEGTAAGNGGDYYDNRDRGHSSLDPNTYSQLKVVSYSETERDQRLDWGGQWKLLPFVTIGNSSTAGPVHVGGSNVRAWYYTTDRGMQFLYTQYRANNLYVYPEHRDHDPGHNGQPGFGDLFPTNSPYVVISKGSSGSDRVFMRALTHTLAAFRPEVKKALTTRGLLMPTLQMILRSSNMNIVDPEEYLTGKAHPTVFIGRDVNPVKLVQAAHRIQLETLPPMVQLKVLSENHAENAVEYFDVGASEKLADTPVVIARIVRGPAYQKRIVVSAADSFDVNNHPLTYHWVVLRGDTQRIQITPRNGGSVAEIVVSYHERRPIVSGSPIDSNRVDIGAFVYNGHTYSAPGFITFYSLDNELRTYDADGRLLEISFDARDLSCGIVDWVALFDMIERKNDTFPAMLLKQAINGQQLAQLAEVGRSCRVAHLQQGIAATHVNNAKAELQKASAAIGASEKMLNIARAAISQSPTDQARAGLERAEADHAAIVNAQKKATQQLRTARRELGKAKAVAQKVVSTQYPVLGDYSVREFVLDRLDTMWNDLGFYIERATMIDQWAATSANEQAIANFNVARETLMKLGTLRQMGSGQLALEAARSGGGLVEQRLTAHEKYQIRRLNHLIVTDLLYPACLRNRESDNFVDSRLTSPRPLRYVYHYDDQGNLTGRSQYDGQSLVGE